MTSRTDNFNRADTTNNIGTPSDGGSAWSQVSGTWGILTNQGYRSSAGGQEICVLESSIANVDVQVTCATAGSDGGVIARCADDNNYLVLVCANANFQLFKRVAGAFTSLGASGAVANGDIAKLRCSANDLTAFRNGSSLITATDAAGSSNTLHGIRANGGDVSRYDDFTVVDLAPAAVARSYTFAW